jgi:hypothetical protein
VADNETTNDDGRVSREAFDRVKGDATKLADENATLKATILGMKTSESARSFFKGKGIDEETAKGYADLVIPHLRDVDPLKVAEVLESDPRFATLRNVPEPSANEAPQEPATPPVEPPTSGGFSGPAPGGSGGTPPTVEKLSIRSPEVQQAIRSNNRAQFEQWEKEGRLDWHPSIIEEG